MVALDPLWLARFHIDRSRVPSASGERAARNPAGAFFREHPLGVERLHLRTRQTTDCLSISTVGRSPDLPGCRAGKRQQNVPARRAPERALAERGVVCRSGRERTCVAAASGAATAIENSGSCCPG